MGDMQPGRFAGILATLPARLPISDWFDPNYPQRRGAWWGDQREHSVSWFDSQATRGAGAYTRRTPNLSARTTYERLQAPGALLWIGEAAEHPPRRCRPPRMPPLQATDNRTRCRIIREHLPWDMIAAALHI